MAVKKKKMRFLQRLAEKLNGLIRRAPEPVVKEEPAAEEHECEEEPCPHEDEDEKE
jgi:hypothetical protein